MTASRRRRKETSWGASPGAVGDELRMPEMWTGLPVKVERMRRWVNDLWPVRRRYSGFGVDMAQIVDCTALCPESLASGTSRAKEEIPEENSDRLRQNCPGSCLSQGD